MTLNNAQADAVQRSFLQRHGFPMLLAGVLSCLGTVLVFLLVQHFMLRSNAEAETKKFKADVIIEARAEADAFLNDLLGGKYDKHPAYGSYAEKVKGYKSWSIENQQIDLANPNCVHFDGTFTGPNGLATFSITEVKQTQEPDKWVIGRFWGPNRSH